MDCIFCKIINGEIPSYTIFEDDKVKAFLDINPVSDGHTLIIPKNHFENIYDIDLDTLKHIEMVSKNLSKILQEKLGATGITRMQNNGHGQDVKHYHMHLIPRFDDDKLEFSLNRKKILNAEEAFKNLNFNWRK